MFSDFLSLTDDALDFSIFWTCSLKATRNGYNYLNVFKQSSLSEFLKKFQNKVGLSMDMKYECEAGYIWSIYGKLG